MKRNAKQTALGGRWRLGLLAAVAAAFLVAPVASALAAEDSEIVFSGAGAGWVKGKAGAEGGVPHIECHWNGTEIDIGTPEPGKCETEAQTVGPFKGITVVQEADAGSEFTEWKVLEGSNVGCTNKTGKQCGVISPPIKIQATFNLEPKHWALNLATSSSNGGSGSFECEDITAATPAAPCASGAEFLENHEVKVIPVASTGSEFVEFNGENGGECSGATCMVTSVETAKNVNAQFDHETFSFSTTEEGEGTVKCAVNGGTLEACPSSTTYGDSIEVVAAPNGVEYVLAEISGTGDAEGCTASPCTFTIDGPGGSSVTAKFKTAAFKDSAKVETVHGEVPETTTLEAEGCEDVDLGEFIPGENANYAETCGVTLTSTGAETKFRASDESAEHTGHLVQGSYFLPSALEVKAVDSESKGTGSATPQPLSPVTMLTFTEPIAKDATTVTFRQHIGVHDGLHTGVYSKTITLTLEQTA